MKDFFKRQGYRSVKLYKLKSRHLFCNVSINNVKGVFIVDTGASDSCIDLTKKEHFFITSKGNPFEASGAGKDKLEAVMAEDCQFKVGRHRIYNQKFVLIDMQHINSAFETLGVKPVDGILGADFLFASYAVIDYYDVELFLAP